MNCVVPDWIATDRATAELAAMTAEQRAAAPTQLPLDDLAGAVVDFVREESLASGVMVLRGGEPRR